MFLHWVCTGLHVTVQPLIHILFSTLKDTFISMKLIWNERTVSITHDSGGFHRVIFCEAQRTRFCIPLPPILECFCIEFAQGFVEPTPPQIYLIFNAQRHFYFNETNMEWKKSLYYTWFRWFPSGNFSVKHSGHDFVPLPSILECFVLSLHGASCNRTAPQKYSIFNAQRHFYFNETNMELKKSLYYTWFRWFPSGNFSVRHSGHDVVPLYPQS